MMVLWLNALLVQQRLSIQSVDGIPTVHVISDNYIDPVEQLNVWKNINKRNWRSIFQPAIEVLRESIKLNPGATSRAISGLAECVMKIEYAQLGLHINVGAELFPKLSEDRKQAAAFYTQPATAEMLARLTIPSYILSDKEWKDPFIFSNRKLADMACGTGTLLRAGYRRIVDLHERYARKDADVSCIHIAAMEGGLVGVDISPIAAHLTTSSLASLGEGDTYGDTQIGWVEVGGQGSKTGSLEYFKSNKLVDLYSNAGIGLASGTNKHTNVSVEVAEGMVDWILMNPPYSRTRGGQSAFDVAGISNYERKQCQKRWGKLIGSASANKKSGMAASFLALAQLKCRSGGRIGFVLPLTAAFAESWEVTRCMIEDSFENITAITVSTGQTHRQKSLSADTGMAEMLLVATKKMQNQRYPTACPSQNQIYCVTLHKPVRRDGEAGEVARAIQTGIERVKKFSANNYPIKIGDDEIGVAFSFTPNQGTPWNSLGVLHADLATAADTLLQGKLHFGETSTCIGIPMTTIGEVFEVGPSHDSIGHPYGGDGRGVFELHPISIRSDEIGQDRSLWKIDWETQQQLIVPPTHKGIVAVGDSDRDRKKIKKVRQSKSILFYNKSIRWTSQALLVASTRDVCLGWNAWTSLQHQNIDICKAFSLWANSTLGLIVHWTQGQRTHAGRSMLRVNALVKIPCPNLDKISTERIDKAVEVFDEISTMKLRPACQSHADSVRQNIDRAVINMLGLGQGKTLETINNLQSLWCNEPSVHGCNRKALKLLGDIRPENV